MSTLILNGDGSFTYTPDDGFVGDDSFTYVALSEGEASGQTTVTITVESVNTAPELSAIGNQTVEEGQLLEFTVSATDTEGDTLTFTLSNAPNRSESDRQWQWHSDL